MNKFKKIEKYFETIYYLTCLKNFGIFIILMVLPSKLNIFINDGLAIFIAILIFFKNYLELKKIDIEFYKMEQQEDIKNILIDIKNGKN